MNNQRTQTGSVTVSGSTKIIGAFTEEQASRLSRLSVHQLRYWARTGFFKPDLGEPDQRGAYNRAYTFRNIAGLRVLGKLRRECNVSLQHLRKVAETLEGMDQSLWNEQTLYVRNREVYFANKHDGYRNVVSGEDTLPRIPLRRVIGEVEKEVARLRQRQDETIGHITKNRNVARNAEVIAGTRIPVNAIKEFYQAGFSISQILKEYPPLEEADVRAALRHFGIRAA
jgi:uncharacterized protein (DUF433 family)